LVTPVKIFHLNFKVAGILMKAFKNIAKNKIVGVVLVDAVNSERIQPQGVDVYNKPNPLFDFGRNSCPFGIVDLIFDFDFSPRDNMELIAQLPQDSSNRYLMNLRKCKIYQSLVSEWVHFRKSAFLVKGIDFEDIPLINFPSGLGLNTTELIGLSTNSRMIHFKEANHFTPFNQTYATIMGENIVQMVHTIRNKN
jgi:hypothetical protein